MGETQIEEAAGLMGAGFDWSHLQALCVRHGVLPLVARQLEAHFSAAVPAEARADLGRAARAALGRSLVLAEELRRVLADLRARGIPALAYKGPALAVQLYGDVAARTFRDLDVLVRRADFPAARAALVELGYGPHPPLTGAQEEALLRSECDQALIHEGCGAVVELHWAVTPPFFSFALTPEELLDRAVEIPLGGQSVAAPGREDLLLLLALNGAKDLWLALEPACLIAELVAGPLDWDLALALARRLRAERLLLLGLSLAGQLLGAPLPERIRRRASEPAVAALAAEAAARLLDERRPAPGLLEIARFRAGSRERWADRLRYFVLWAGTPTRDDCAVLPLPRRFWGAAYAIRPLRLLARTITGRSAGP
jgi:hypothetical protein